MSPFRLLLTVVLTVGAGYVAWAAAGAHVVAVLDHLTTAHDGDRPTPTWFAIDDGDASFSIENRRWPIPSTWRIVEIPMRHVTLETPEGSLTLGVIVRAWTTTGNHHSYEFRPDSGDVVALARRHSRLSWPTPMAFNVLGGRYASAGRYVYDRLLWRKADGRTMEIVWRDKQRYLAADGWRDELSVSPPVVTFR